MDYKGSPWGRGHFDWEGPFYFYQQNKGTVDIAVTELQRQILRYRNILKNTPTQNLMAQCDQCKDYDGDAVPVDEIYYIDGWGLRCKSCIEYAQKDGWDVAFTNLDELETYEDIINKELQYNYEYNKGE